jgi:hypothetical protein
VQVAERLTQRTLGGRTTAWLRAQEQKQQRPPEPAAIAGL